MVPLLEEGTRHARSWIPPAGRGLLALHHALAFGRPGLRGDDARTPRSLLLVRDGDGQLEAFGVGEPGPAVAWLVGHRGRAVSLLAPQAEWWEAVLGRVGAAEIGEVETWSGTPGGAAPRRPPAAGAPAEDPPLGARPLGGPDEAAFLASAPSWALRGWGSYGALLEHGAAFGVPHRREFAALAWVFDQTVAPRFDAVGVFTAPRFRRLGLGRAAASALIAHIVGRRRQVPLWSFAAENAASRALARSLGLTPAATQPILRWPPRAGGGAGRGGEGAEGRRPGGESTE